MKLGGSRIPGILGASQSVEKHKDCMLIKRMALFIKSSSQKHLVASNKIEKNRSMNSEMHLSDAMDSVVIPSIPGAR